MPRQGNLVFASVLWLAIFVSACTPMPTPTRVPPTVVPAPTVAPTSLPPSPTPVPPAMFTFPKGAMWTYQGVVKWELKGKAQQKTLTWKMSVTDKIERADGVVGYVMNGHPFDLAFYEDGKKPSDYLYLAKANRVYQITLLDAKPIERVKNSGDALVDLLVDDNLVFDFPFTVGKKFGPAQLTANSDGMNYWTVTEQKQTTLLGVKGIANPEVIESTLNFKTNPDNQSVFMVPSIGITRFVYHHNGTLSDVDVKLIEYSAGAVVATTGQCELVASKAITAYTRPSTQAPVFGKLAVGDSAPVGGTTADGWIGFDPGVAQAANVGPFRLRWVQKSDAFKLQGACDAPNVPVLANLPPTACFEMFMADTKIYPQANVTASALVIAKANDYAQVVAANDKWLELDLNVGSLKQAKRGWIERADANFNGACDKLPVAKP